MLWELNRGEAKAFPRRMQQVSAATRPQRVEQVSGKQSCAKSPLNLFAFEDEETIT